MQNSILAYVNFSSKFSAVSVNSDNKGARLPNDILNNFFMLRNIATEVGMNINGMKPALRFGPAATTALPDDRQLCASAPACWQCGRMPVATTEAKTCVHFRRSILWEFE